MELAGTSGGMRTVFVGTCAFWPDEPVDHDFDPIRLVGVGDRALRGLQRTVMTATGNFLSVLVS
jgi:hypothetical protein